MPGTGKLSVITGPSGVGKGTLVKRLLERHPEVWLSVSATTRAPREGEQEGVSYFFHSRESFDDLVAQNGLLEWAEFAGNCYGTPRQPVEDQLKSGHPVLLEIELEGARQVRQTFEDGFQIFLAPPALRSLSAEFAAVAPMPRRRSSAALPGRRMSWRQRVNLMLLL